MVAHEKDREQRDHAIAIAFDDLRPRNRFLNVSGYLFGIILNARRVQEITCKLFCTTRLSHSLSFSLSLPSLPALFAYQPGWLRRVAIVLLMRFYFGR